MPQRVTSKDVEICPLTYTGLYYVFLTLKIKIQMAYKKLSHYVECNQNYGRFTFLVSNLYLCFPYFSIEYIISIYCFYKLKREKNNKSFFFFKKKGQRK